VESPVLRVFDSNTVDTGLPTTSNGVKRLGK